MVVVDAAIELGKEVDLGMEAAAAVETDMESDDLQIEINWLKNCLMRIELAELYTIGFVAAGSNIHHRYCCPKNLVVRLRF